MAERTAAGIATPRDLKELSRRERRELAGSAGTSTALERLLATDEERSVRRALAGQSGLILDVQHLLAHDDDPGVRCELAVNESLLPELQHLLAGDEHPFVRRAVAMNASVVLEVQVSLANDPESEVWWYLAVNDALTPTDAFPCAFLEVRPEGQAFIAAHLEAAGLAAEDVDALRKGWTGTLGELVETARELSSHGA
jgi:hypothetical protein